ncbi:protein transport protein Sec24C [Pseudochaenichthys georgianus]|uniref:protein transport protein Sec24C n=1 Tax=Pseudochaenichthys georgianus TaxID=52239 RepID=UPI00146CF729|nr:protein transport protein Sec24C [Pseudochaenichthys georgianus]XP_033946127.1 protein transport protein Sec24C [Pseudochaenichthys georgianus]
MMDVPTANQSDTPCQPWAGQNGWSPASPQGPPCNPLPSFQNLSLSSPSDQRPGYEQLQVSNHGYQSELATFSSRNNTEHSALYANNADHSVQRVTPDAHASSMVPSASQGRYIPPCSLALMKEGTHPCNPQQMPFYSPHSPYQGISSPLQPPYTHHCSLNGPQSPQQKHLPITTLSFGVNQSPQFTPQPAFERANVESSVGYTHTHSSPQWTLTTNSRGTTDEFVPNAAAEDRNITPQSPSSESRYGLDPELLPSVVKVIADDSAEWEGKVFVSEAFSRLPPLATTSCIVEDRGNASPLAIRSASYCMPCDAQTALLSRLPLGALVTPLAKQNDGEPLPVCTEPECVSDCGCCGASMCPAMGWQDCGQRFYCPFCGKLSEVPWQHYQPTKGVEGARLDRDNRPELSMGSYEKVNSQKGEPAALLLAIDVSASAVRGGHLEFATQQILTLLTSLKMEDGDVRVGLMTYDSRIHLYDLSPALSRPHMLVITETEDLQLPVREGLLVPLKDCIDSIDSVLQLVPQFSPECDGSSGVPIELPVKAGLAVLQALSCPGKLLIFHTAPLTEMGLTHSSSGFFGSNKPKSIFQPSDPAISLAKECVSQGCGVSLFVLSQQDVGGAWPGHIPYLTGGALYTYSHLQGELDRERFSTDLNKILETDTGYKAELRIFVSKDMRVSGCYGLFLPGPSPSQVTMATVDWRTTLAVELAHSRALDEARGVAIQTVLSYSTRTGDRRTRVHTLTLRCSRHLQDTFRQYQAQTLLTFYSKKIYCTVLERPLQELREELQTEVTEALASYRRHCCSASVSAGQLVLPQYLRALPVYINSLRKSEVLLPGLRSSIHQRLQQRCQVLGMDTCSTSTHFYPLLLPLPLAANHSVSPPPPEALRCCAASLEPGCLYLIHAPLTLLLWVGDQVPSCTLVELFNNNCFSSLLSGETKLPVLDNPLSIRVRSLISTLNSQAPCARKLWVVKQGDTCEEALQRHLVEDKSPNGGASYADFLYHLHVNSVRLLQ